MARKRFTPEQIIAKLRETKVLIAQGQFVVQACKRIEVAEQMFPAGAGNTADSS